MSFTHLQVRTGYSFFNSTITIEKLIKRAAQLKMTALSITDENALFGAIPFYKACLSHGIKPIIGMTVNVLNEEGIREEIVVLAKNNNGYKNLVKLTTTIQRNGKNEIEKELLGKFTEHLVGILPVKKGQVERLIMSTTYDHVEEFLTSWKSIFTVDDFYLGISHYGQEQDQLLVNGMRAYHNAYHTKVVAIHDVRYLMEKDVKAYECLQAMKYGKSWNGTTANYTSQFHQLLSQQEMEQLFSAWPEALYRTEEIVSKCNVSFDFDSRMIPAYPVPNGLDAHDYLSKLCWENLDSRYNTITKELRNRLTHELSIIQRMGYSDYFLIVWDFIKYAKENHIMVGPGRGSSAGSLVAYSLGITDVDPMKYQLVFERFLNPERVTMPDIDVDFSDQRRDEVITYVRDKYGEEHVAQIITFGTFAARSLIRELGKTMSIDSQDIYFILKHIPNQTSNSIASLLKSSKELLDYVSQNQNLKMLFQIAAVLEGIPRHTSTHAAGVVISETPLVDHVPLTVGATNTALTQFPMTDLESLGLLKMDFLGLRNLTILERIVESIHYKEKKDFQLDQIPEGDSLTFDLLKKGKTNGVFQLESDGMKQVLKRLVPNTFDDIVAVNALYRPGPMDFIPTYIDRKHGRKPTTYPHPDLEPILESTYGVLIYQEQIMQIAHRIAGYTLGQADVLRRAVSKKKQDIMDAQKEAFIAGCMKNGYEKKVGEEIFAWIVKFSNYGFPKSHAVAYSKISYQLAYLKAHYPRHFYAELLTSIGNQQDKIQAYMNEMKELHIKVGSPSINKSFGRFSVEDHCIRMGLLSIKGIGNQTVQEILRARKEGPFKNLFDFCLRVTPKLVNRQSLEALIMAGAFDETYPNRASLLASIDQAMEQGELFREFTDQPTLFQDQLDLVPSYVNIEDFSLVRKLADEKELLGIYVSSHPLKEYREKLRENGFITLDHAQDIHGKKVVKSAVIIQEIKTIRTKRGEPMAFLKLSDETRDMDAVVFPEQYRLNSPLIKEEALVFIEGKIEFRNGKTQWLLSAIVPFDDNILKNDSTARLFIKITEKTSKEGLNIVRDIATNHPGATPIIVHYEEQKRTYQLSKDYFIHISNESLEALAKYFGKENVVYEAK
ncbi:DNA polymerase III subunit alpha [Ornithinibacillus bavariensis]|uniref:DNA polymerase III subunit alpha n=1 Tax=Ornithinibacillus bavariensis TaxID=545502 RepID=UPI003D1B0E34